LLELEADVAILADEWDQLDLDFRCLVDRGSPWLSVPHAPALRLGLRPFLPR
jgi:hypothetical protein